MNVIDTNVWIDSHDTRDPTKQALAQNLIGSLRPLALPWQVGCEFIAAGRKLAALGFAEAVLLPAPQLWPAARDLQSRYALSFWDALLVGAPIQGGVQTLYTEDMGAPRVIDGLSLVNPFLTIPPSAP